MSFVKWVAVLLEVNTDWKWNFHHEYLCKILQEETFRIKEKRERDKHIIINVPFRSSKSLICSICYPIWSWMVNPEMSFINLSYSDNLSTDHSNKVVSIIQHPKFQELFSWEFDEVQRSKTDFKLKTGGSRLSGGVSGTVLGRGADVIVMDDPNNTRRLSAVERHNTIKAWTDTISTRLNDPLIGLFIVIQQRLHQEDLTGYLIDKTPENWWNVTLPAELGSNVNPPELAEFYKNGLLWENRFSIKVLDDFKLVLGSVGYANQLNQLTSPEEGGIIKRKWIEVITWEKFQEKLNINKFEPRWDMFLDSAQTEKKKNDPSGILICCKILNDLYVRKVIEKKLTMPDLLEVLKTLMNSYNVNRLFIEPKSSGKDIVAMLRRQTSYNILETPTPLTDKTTRLNAVSPLIEGGRLILIEDISNDIIIDQLCEFPNASNDEFVDLTGYALTKFIKSSGLNYLML
jgi:predicted phage terminase large subunit-like protein